MMRHRPRISHPIFTLQKHKATTLHYDFRLEIGGLLKSWAVPKGPSLDPRVKRLAVAVDDHPVDYANFEGVIEEGQYGAGPVLVWDLGWYQVLDGDRLPHDAEQQLGEGKLDFVLFGKRLKGAFSLVRVKGRPSQWLLIKHKDAHSHAGVDITDQYDTSVLTGRKLEHMEEDARAGILRPVHAG